MLRKALGVVLGAVMCLSIGVPAAAAGGVLFPPASDPYGMSYAQWQGDYQIWFNEIPTPDNPYQDPGSSLNCATSSGGEVVYLGGSGANCDVPEGKALAFTTYLGFWECSTGEGHGETFQELRRCANHNFARDIKGKLRQRITVDGHRIRHLSRWVTRTPGEVIDFPADNIWGAVPGPSNSMTKGYLYMLRPPSAGDHLIKVKLTYQGLSARYRWRLHVVPEV